MKLKTNWFHILAALAEKTRHGAEVQRRVSAVTEGAVTLYPASLYGALDGMEAAGLIEEVADPDDVPDYNERRRYYALTSVGLEVLRAETDRLEAVARSARLALEQLSEEGRP